MELSNPQPIVSTPPSFSNLSVGQTLPAKTFSITRGDLVNYAGVAGDPNPIHFSDTFASKVGLPGVIAHGMLVMGLVSGYITDWLVDPGSLVEFGVRFSNPVVVPATSAAEVVISAKVKTLDEEKNTVELLITATSGESKVLSKATALAKLK